MFNTYFILFFFNEQATTVTYPSVHTLPLPDSLPIFANLFMMAVAETRIDAQHDRAAAKQLGPAVQDFHAIDGDENPARQRLHVVLARCKAGREQIGREHV